MKGKTEYQGRKIIPKARKKKAKGGGEKRWTQPRGAHSKRQKRGDRKKSRGRDPKEKRKNRGGELRSVQPQEANS